MSNDKKPQRITVVKASFLFDSAIMKPMPNGIGNMKKNIQAIKNLSMMKLEVGGLILRVWFFEFASEGEDQFFFWCEVEGAAERAAAGISLVVQWLRFLTLNPGGLT